MRKTLKDKSAGQCELEDGPGVSAAPFCSQARTNGRPRRQTCEQIEALRCEIEDGPSIAAETCRRHACDCSLVHITEDENGNPLDIGRKTRTIPPSIRRALNSRDKGCRFPGCCNKKFVDGHHIKHWANGGETKLSNLVSLCRFHHRLVHEGGVEVLSLDDGAIRFVKPSGQSFDSVIPGFTQPLSDWKDVPAAHERAHICIDERTAATKWGGESMDYGLAVQVLLQQNAKCSGGVMR